MHKSIAIILSSACLSIALMGSAYVGGRYFYQSKGAPRLISVKGLAQTEVESNLGVWEINYREIGENLISIDQQLQKDKQVVINFLSQQGFTASEFNNVQLKIVDQLAYSYSDKITDEQRKRRFVVTAGVRIRSNKVKLIQQSEQHLEKLIQAGVPLSFEANSSPNPSYYYTELDTIRPHMLAAATQSAYTIAQQFAENTHNRLGKVQYANQGVFQIMSKDTTTQNLDWNNNMNALGSIEKSVRLVTTVQYRLQ